jgi:hypothetical protein
MRRIPTALAAAPKRKIPSLKPFVVDACLDNSP